MRPLQCESGPGSDCNEWVLCIPQSASITGILRSDCLVSYRGHSIEVGGGLNLCRDAVGMFCSPLPQPTGQYDVVVQHISHYATLTPKSLVGASAIGPYDLAYGPESMLTSENRTHNSLVIDQSDRFLYCKPWRYFSPVDWG